MNIKLICDDKDYQQVKSKLEQVGMTISSESNWVLYDSTVHMKSLIGRIQSEYEMINISDIVYIESYAHEVICYTMDKNYTIKEKLYQIEGLYEEDGFIRINQSTVINKSFIHRIKPSFNTKFILTMKNGVKVDVTRSYYHKFKSYLNL